MKKIFIILAVVISFGICCHITMAKDKVIAKDYLTMKGYTIVSYEGNAKFKLTQEILAESPHMTGWEVQNVNPAKYIGKTINIERFIISNHPLDNWKQQSNTNTINSEGKTRVTVFVVNNKIIGGTSHPFIGEQILEDTIWSLDGKKFAEVHLQKDSEELTNDFLS
ncbi:hypothetical protein [Desulfolucanica intricata]|uniref:hypothetical protein n=1 Tax=Desulfolucanica intricata TaxID=1285191 RepID=UPI00082FDFD1|nr:hypothetical protein [Desulfolucanica intricata]